VVVRVEITEHRLADHPIVVASRDNEIEPIGGLPTGSIPGDRPLRR
jgi:hypothetical protein